MIEEMKNIVEKNCFVNAKLNKANEVIKRITELHSSDDNILKFEDILKVNISLIKIKKCKIQKQCYSQNRAETIVIVRYLESWIVDSDF